MIEGFVLPKGFSAFAEDRVGLVGGVALEGLDDFLERHSGLEHEMDVIGHDYVSQKLIEPANFFAMTKRLHN